MIKKQRREPLFLECVLCDVSVGFISTGYAERVRCAIMFNVDCFIVASYIPNTDLNNAL